MKIRFEVDQASCFRAGVDCPVSVCTLEVDPAKLDQDTRNLIADHLIGIKLYRRIRFEDGTEQPCVECPMVADRPTFESLLEAIKANVKECEAIKKASEQEAQRVMLASGRIYETLPPPLEAR